MVHPYVVGLETRLSLLLCAACCSFRFTFTADSIVF